MRETVIFLLFCVIVNKVTAPAPFSLPNTNQPPKTTTPTTTTTKLPKWNEYASKNSGPKPIKDNAYLATLVNMPPKGKTKQTIEINKTEERKEKSIEVNNKKESLNDTRILFAEEIGSYLIDFGGNNSKENEIVPSIELAGNGSKEKEIASQMNKQDSKFKLNNTEPKKGVKLQELLKPLLTKPKANNTEGQSKSFEIPPTMIPIFRPNPNLTKKDNLDASLITPKPIISPVQEKPTLTEDVIELKEAKSNLNPSSNAAPFNIPCHRASDILDEVPINIEVIRAPQANFENNAKSESPVSRAPQVNFDFNAKSESPNSRAPQANFEYNAKSESLISQEPNQVERPQKLETDESLAIIFKPKNISLLNVYGDMLKKITLTVLVPYHMSKLGT